MTSTSPSAATRATQSVSSVNNFKKGTKHDATAYPTLKDMRLYNKFILEFTALARAHDVHQVLDTDYTPSTPTEVDLFAEKQAFVYAVLVKSLKTDITMSFVREHTKDGDAQAVFRKLKKEADVSTSR